METNIKHFFERATCGFNRTGKRAAQRDLLILEGTIH